MKYPKGSYLYELDKLDKAKKNVKKELMKPLKYIYNRHRLLFICLEIIALCYLLAAIYFTITTIL